ncbi:predicted protein [Naegleria gruberi]|uniref:Predicted protein n=1 Tax=Naegleria gruberi TaxID=5762 RepID=D2V177_NAEGR|nr:uncharacterized protein NAEGRDRAFT_62787 [Naegleria gruberi]EFC49260.1 predicted protein [Naegleria gruberi]|eukprot:XP_002682004.1 predicted protein [Naegleria gruberi strain NEG-M]
MSQQNNTESSAATTAATQPSVPAYNLLGSSGLRVFPLCLGTMGFGQNPITKTFGIGGSDEESEKILLKYLEIGGNFIDTANFYAIGKSEELIGNLIKKHNLNRDELIIATKFSLPMTQHANGGGNHKKNLIQSLDASLKRLQLDYVDLFYVHFWDFTVDAKQLIIWLDEIVKSGKVLHVAVSDMPAYQVAIANTYAEDHGLTKFVAYQGRYSLVDRALEQEIIPMTKSLDLGTVPWGVLGAGKLTGKKLRNQEEKSETERKFVEMSQTDYDIQDVVIEIAKELNRTPSQVAINWMISQGVSSVLIGPRTLEQFEDNIKSLEFRLNQEQLKRLNQVSANSPSLIFPYNFIGQDTQSASMLYFNGNKFSINKK